MRKLKTIRTTFPAQDNVAVKRQKLNKWPYLVVWKGKHRLVLNFFHQVFFLVTTLDFVVTQTPANKQISHGLRFTLAAASIWLVFPACTEYQHVQKKPVILNFHLVYPWFPSEQNAEPISRPNCDSLKASSWFEPMTWSTVNCRARIGESPDRREATTARVSPKTWKEKKSTWSCYLTINSSSISKNTAIRSH